MLLLIDEVQTGWCRIGKVMSYMNYGIKPEWSKEFKDGTPYSFLALSRICLGVQP